MQLALLRSHERTRAYVNSCRWGAALALRAYEPCLQCSCASRGCARAVKSSFTAPVHSWARVQQQATACDERAWPACLSRGSRSCSLAPAVLAEVEAQPAEQALALMLLPAIGQAHVLACPPPPDGARAIFTAAIFCMKRS